MVFFSFIGGILVVLATCAALISGFVLREFVGGESTGSQLALGLLATLLLLLLGLALLIGLLS